ncbi:MAG: hypothetical protein H0U69_03620 [Trueperaceae bacterium]|nr:hypothetical protein [Trueperaceae bacterium]
MPRTETANTDRPTLEALKARIVALGETPSGCWEDDHHVYAFSARGLGSGTYGHPALTLHWQAAGRYYIETITPRKGR